VRKLLILCCLFQASISDAQVTGGESILQFLRLSPNAHVSAMGGMCVSNPEQDLMFAISSPALLKPTMHNNLSLSNNFYIAGTNINTAAYALYKPKLKTTFMASARMVNYGNQSLTDASGNVLGNAKAQDAAIAITASRQYKTKWQYGATLQFAQQRMAGVAASAILGDAGLHYSDTANQLYFGMVAKNIGVPLKTFSANQASEPLPFDMQMGISKKFLKAPVRLNVLVHHLYQWDIRYDNPADRIDNVFLTNDSNATTKSYFADKLFRHFNFSADIILGKTLNFTVGYSHQRRSELALSQKKGMSGFSYGLSMHLKKFDLYFARSIYHVSGNYNELSINMPLAKTFGLGKTWAQL
jgi:hypothetical protein